MTNEWLIPHIVSEINVACEQMELKSLISQIQNIPNAIYASNPAWSPDGSKIAYADFVGPNYDIYVMDSDGSNRTRLTTHEKTDYAPSWSPDGLKLAFHSNRDNLFQIYIINSDGTGLRRLTNSIGHDFQAVWSPDGEYILFESDERNGQPQDLYIIKQDGTDERRITDWKYADMGPAWSR